MASVYDGMTLAEIARYDMEEGLCNCWRAGVPIRHYVGTNVHGHLCFTVELFGRLHMQCRAEHFPNYGIRFVDITDEGLNLPDD